MSMVSGKRVRAARPQNRRKILYSPTLRAIKKAVEILKQGGLVAFPTETVYGLGARALDAAAVEKIFSVKGRPADNPVIVHVTEAEQIDLLVAAIPSSAEALMARFWPGPLTLVFKRSHRVPAIVSAGLETVAIRSPDHPVAQALIRGLGEPIAAPSANRSGRPSPTRAEHVVGELGDRVPFILDGGPCRIGVESTVLDLVSDPPRILRPGAVTAEALEAVIGEVLPFSPREGTAASRSPGEKHRHYAPNLKMVLVPPQRLESALSKGRQAGKRLGLLCRQSGANRAGVDFYRSIRGGEEAYARGIFAALAAAEAAGVELLVVETVKKKGIGVAVMDRLERAARGSNKSGPV